MVMAVLHYTWVLILLSCISEEVFSQNVGRNDEKNNRLQGLLALGNNAMDGISRIQNKLQHNRAPEYHSGSLELNKMDLRRT